MKSKEQIKPTNVELNCPNKKSRNYALTMINFLQFICRPYPIFFENALSTALKKAFKNNKAKETEKEKKKVVGAVGSEMSA